MTLTLQQRDKWVLLLGKLESDAQELKLQAAEELPWGPVGSHPIVCGLAAAEGTLWALRDGVSRFPIAEHLQPDKPDDN